MTDPDLEYYRLTLEAAGQEAERQIGVRKVVYGTLVVGVAVAFFPFAQKTAESWFTERIERIKADYQVLIAERESTLQKELANLTHELELGRLREEELQRTRVHYESFASEGRSQVIETRIRLAQFYAFLSRADEQENWKKFLKYLEEQRDKEVAAREELRIAIATGADPEQAAAALNSIIRLNDPAAGQNPFLAKVPIPTSINQGLTLLKTDDLLAKLGSPRETFGSSCNDVTDPWLNDQMATEDVGPFRVRLIKPAIMSLREAFAKLKAENPAVYDQIGSLGGLCVRTLSGSTKLSNHSWGTAVDISISGQILGLGAGKLDGMTAAGSLVVARYLNEAGWFWGAGFRNFEDEMHFEVSKELLDRWFASGTLSR